MAKYKDQGRKYGKKILAVLLAVATVLTTSSIDMQALAMGGVGDDASQSVNRDGYIGQVITNDEGSAQQVTGLKFKLNTTAGVNYSYRIKVSQNTTENDPESGVERYTTDEISFTADKTGATEIPVTITNGDNNKPIVLDKNEKLGVSIQLWSNLSTINYYKQSSGTGFYKRTADDETWEKTGNIIEVTTENGSADDLDSITVVPDTDVMTVGDTSNKLTITKTPNYMRTITVDVDNNYISKATSGDVTKVNALKTGTGTVTASGGGKTTEVPIYVFRNSLTDESTSAPSYTTDYSTTFNGQPQSPKVWVELGEGNYLAKDTNYSVTYTNADGSALDKNVGTKKVTITGLGIYDDYSKTYDYEVTKADLTPNMVKSGTYSINTETGAVTATITSDTAGILEASDYTATATIKSTDIEHNKVTYRVKVKATDNGNFKDTDVDNQYQDVEVSGSSSSKININAVVNATIKNNQSNFTYTGEGIKPEVVFTSKSSPSTEVDFKNNVNIEYPENVDASNTLKKIVISGKGNYEGTIELSYYIDPLDIDDDNIKVEIAKETSESPDRVWTHTGYDVEPGLTKVALYKGDVLIEELKEGEDYELDYDQNKNISTNSKKAKIILYGIGNYTGEREEKFTIIGDFVNDAVVTVQSSYRAYPTDFISEYSVPYDGTAHEPTTSVTLGGKVTLTPGTDYEVTHSNNINAGTGEIKFTGKGNYANKGFTVKYTISPIELSGRVDVHPTQQRVYHNDAKTLDPNEYDVYDSNNNKLTYGTDYTVDAQTGYTNNINAGTANIIVKGIGNYTGNLTGQFTIDKLDINDNDVKVDAIDDQSWTGAQVTPSVSITLNGTPLSTSDYDVSYSNNIMPGKATVTIKAKEDTATTKSNYYGERTTTFNIKPQYLTSLKYYLKGKECTGTGETRTATEFKPTYTGGEVLSTTDLSVYDGDTEVLPKDNYTIIAGNWINAGNGSVIVKGKNSYKGSVVTINFTISQKSIEDDDVTVECTDATYDETTHKWVPTIKVTNNGAAFEEKKTLIEGTDYTVEYKSDMTTAGKKTAIVHGMNNYTGDVTVNFSAGTDISDGIVTLELPNPDAAQPEKVGNVYEVTYIGENKPTIYVMAGGEQLKPGQGLDIVWPTTIIYDANQGTNKVTLNGSGKYYGTIEVQYKVIPKDIKGITEIGKDRDVIVTEPTTSTEYNASTRDIAPIITYIVDPTDRTKDVTLVKGTSKDFTTTPDTIGPDVVASVTTTIKGTGNFTGTRDGNTYSITKKNINKGIVTDKDIEVTGLNDEEYYTGSQITPIPVIKQKRPDGTYKTLIKDTDYTLSYGDNETGTGTVTITGTDPNYEGTYIHTFNIVRKNIATDTNITITVDTEKTYIGEAITPSVWITDKQGTVLVPLKEGYDYELSYPTDTSNTLVGEYKEASGTTPESGPRVTITGMDKYEGTVTKGFTIKGDISNTTLFQVGGLDADYYDIVRSGNTYSVPTLDSATGYSVQYKTGTQAGEKVCESDGYQLIKPSTIAPGSQNVEVKSNNTTLLTGSCKKSIKLRGNLRDLTDDDVVYDTDQKYTGTDVKPVPKVYYNSKEIPSSDLKFDYAGNLKDVGGTPAPTFTISSNSEFYKDSKGPFSYSIKYDLNQATVTGVTNKEYTGSQVTQDSLVVTLNGRTLTKDTDYIVEPVTNCKDVGPQTMVIKPKSGGTPATGEKTFTFTITPITLNQGNCTVTFPTGAYPFTGQPIEAKPESVTCTKSAEPLVEHQDYELEYLGDKTSTGEQKVKVKGKGNYTGEATGYYYIGSGVFTDADVIVDDTKAYYAGGKPVTPVCTVKFNGTIQLTEGVDYTINCSNNTQVSADTQATIVVTGIGSYAGSSVTKNFRVRKADLGLATISMDETESTYTGLPITANIKVYIDAGAGVKAKLNPGTDYDVTYNSGKAMQDADEYLIVVTGKGDNYEGSCTGTYTITPKSVEKNDITIKLDKTDWDYTGQAITPTVTVKDTTRNETLTEGQDYTLEITDNVNAGHGKVTITGLNNYTDSKSTTFNIGHEFDADIFLDNDTFIYDGPDSQHKPNLTVTQGGNTLQLGTDYTVEYMNNDEDDPYATLDGNAGTKVVRVTGINNYYGSYREKEYKVVAKTAVSSKIRVIPALAYENGHYYAIYNGDAQEPAVTVYDDEISTTVPVDPENYVVGYSENNTEMTKGGNYAKIYVNWKDRGEKSNYTKGSDAYTVEFEIKAKEVTPSDFEATLIPEQAGQGNTYAYTGNVITPKATVRARHGEIVGEYLTEGKDYIISYSDNVKAGQGIAIITGINNYSGTVELPFNIVAQLSDAVAPIPDQLFTGEPVKPKFTVTCGGNTLVEGVDYNVSYRSDDDYQTSGVAKIDTNSPYYSGSKEIKYNIVFDPSLLKVTNYNPTYTYTGGSIRPDFIVQAPDGTIIPYDKNAVTYMNSSTGAGDTTSIGTITASIPVTIGTPENHKTAVLKAVYSIVSKNVNNASVTVARLADNVYTGKALTPPVYIKDGNTQLTEGVDYTLSYSNNTNPGVGTVIITGKGEYEGKRSEPFYIIAPKVLGLTGTVGSDSSVTLSWLKNAHVSGYDIYSQDGSKKYGSTTANSFNIPASKAGNETVFKVRTYVTVNGKRTDGEFSEVTVYTGLAKPVVTITSYARKRATLNWSPQTNVSGYEIYRGTSPDGNFSKIAVMPTTSGGYSDSGLTSGQTYYYKVRAYQKTGENAFVYGHFSDVKSVVVK